MRNAAIVAAAVLIVVGFVTVSFAASKVVGPNAAEKITVKGEIKSDLKVTLSDTTIDFGTLAVGEQKKFIDITCEGMGGKATYMSVKDAANLKKADGKTVDTKYAVQTKLGTDSPSGTDYKAANQFNVKHNLTKANKLWAKVTPVAGSEVGSYSNVMTVTFSQNL